MKLDRVKFVFDTGKGGEISVIWRRTSERMTKEDEVSRNYSAGRLWNWHVEVTNGTSSFGWLTMSSPNQTTSNRFVIGFKTKLRKQ